MGPFPYSVSLVSMHTSAYSLVVALVSMQLLVVTCCKSDYRNIGDLKKHTLKKSLYKNTCLVGHSPSTPSPFKELLWHSSWQCSPINSCSITLMWQYYLVCGLSNLRGVGQEFHKLALLPENYIVKWCLRWIALMFTCKKSTDGSFHSGVKIEEKKHYIHDHLGGSPKHRQLSTVMWTVSTNHCVAHAWCYFPPQKYFSTLIYLCPFQPTEHCFNQ